jgi:hypothetical protein
MAVKKLCLLAIVVLPLSAGTDNGKKDPDEGQTKTAAECLGKAAKKDQPTQPGIVKRCGREANGSDSVNVQDITYHRTKSWRTTPRLITGDIVNYCSTEVEVTIYVKYYSDGGDEISMNSLQRLVPPATKSHFALDIGQAEYKSDWRTPATGRVTDVFISVH